MPRPLQEHLARGFFVPVHDGQQRLRLFVRSEGPQSGETVLLVHGAPASSYLFRAVATHLAAAGLRAVSFDLPGFGLSDKPANVVYSWPYLARAAAQLVDALNLHAVHVVAHDIGGPIAAHFAGHLAPSRIRSMTWSNTLLRVCGYQKPFPMWLFDVRVAALPARPAARSGR